MNTQVRNREILTSCWLWFLTFRMNSGMTVRSRSLRSCLNFLQQCTFDWLFFWIWCFSRQRLVPQRPEATLRTSSPPRQTPALRTRPPATRRTVLRGHVRCALTHPHTCVSKILQNTLYFISRYDVKTLCMSKATNTREFPAAVKAQTWEEILSIFFLISNLGLIF